MSTDRPVRRSLAGRTAAPAGKAAATPPRPRSRLFYRGAEAVERVDYELEQQKIRREASAKKGSQPFRFFVGVGETKEFVVLDETPDFFLYEHTMQDPATGKWGHHESCIQAFDNCPICEKVGPSVYTMFLSVLDLTPYKDRSGVTHEFSRKLLAVKPSQHKKFLRYLAKNDTLRGAIFETTRDGPKDAAVGNDIQFVEYMDEEELIGSYIRKWKDKEGKPQTENCGEVYDYEALFPEPTRDELAALVGAEATPGSKAQQRRDMGGDYKSAADDDAPWKDDDGVPPTPRRSSRVWGRAAAKEDTPVRRPTPGRRGAAAQEEAPPRRTRDVVRRPARGRPAEDFDDDVPM